MSGGPNSPSWTCIRTTTPPTMPEWPHGCVRLTRATYAIRASCTASGSVRPSRSIYANTGPTATVSCSGAVSTTRDSANPDGPNGPSASWSAVMRWEPAASARWWTRGWATPMPVPCPDGASTSTIRACARLSNGAASWECPLASISPNRSGCTSRWTGIMTD